MMPLLLKLSNNMHKGFLLTAAYIGALSVALGAFGAHTLKDQLPQPMLHTFETAVRYQFYHVFALLATGMLYGAYPNKMLILAGRLFINGIILFSGSLYLLIFFSLHTVNNFHWIGAITPLGGILLIAGWICLAIGIGRGTPV